MRSKKSVIFGIGISTFVVSLFAVPLALSFQTKDKITFANFESYASDEVMNRMRTKYDVSFMNYNDNESLEVKFKNYYDIATPSTYELFRLYKKGWLHKIDYKNDFKLNGINTKEDLYAKLTDNMQKIIDTLDAKFQKDPYAKDFHLLDYGVPYFLQNFAFAYIGDKISSLDGLNKWSTLMPEVNKFDYFKPVNGSNHRIAMVDDGRTVYGISKVACTEVDSPNDVTINPTNQNESIDSLKKDYSTLFNNFKKNVFFNSDSRQILSSFADQKNKMTGCIAYNGDLLYAARGADLVDPYSSDKFHYTQMESTVMALDMVVINKNVEKYSEKEKYQTFGAVKEIALDGQQNDESGKPVDIKETIGGEDGPYKYGTMENFDFVNYTTPFKNISDYVEDLSDDGYFGDYKDADQRKLYKEIFETKIPSTPDKIALLFENDLDELTKSNMSAAYNRIKANL